LYITCCPEVKSDNKDACGKELYRKRSVYSDTGSLADLKCQEFSGWYKKFTRMAATDFELLVNLVSLKIVKSGT